MKDAVPFLQLPDASLVALWCHASEPAVVLINGHGGLRVLACDFDSFLWGISERSSGLSEIDQAEERFAVPGIGGKLNAAGLPALQEKFEKWFNQHTSLLEPLATSEAEALRGRVYGIAQDMIRNGHSKVYTLSSPWWSMEFQVERVGDVLSLSYLDFGKWYPVPPKYKLAAEARALLALVKNKTRRRYELSTCSAGVVSVDNDRELVLAPPKGTAS